MLIRRVLAGGAAAAMCATLLAACSSGDDSSDEPSASFGGQESLFTPPGTNLSFDESAVIKFSAGRKRQSTIDLKVTGVQEGSAKDLAEFDLNKAARDSGVYYVRATVRNVGHGDLGGAFVKLYAKVSDTLVVQPVIFGSTFGKCNYQPLPKPFGAGKRADVCMVMLAPDHGTVSAVEWRFAGHASDEAPITWEKP